MRKPFGDDSEGSESPPERRRGKKTSVRNEGGEEEEGEGTAERASQLGGHEGPNPRAQEPF